MRKNLGRLCLILLSLALACEAFGCGSKINQDNFEKIQTSMTREQVEKILGPPTESSGVNLGAFSGGASTWKDGDSVITIQFLNGEVMAKQFTKSTQPQAQEKR